MSINCTQSIVWKSCLQDLSSQMLQRAYQTAENGSDLVNQVFWWATSHLCPLSHPAFYKDKSSADTLKHLLQPQTSLLTSLTMFTEVEMTGFDRETYSKPWLSWEIWTSFATSYIGLSKRWFSDRSQTSFNRVKNQSGFESERST